MTNQLIQLRSVQPVVVTGESDCLLECAAKCMCKDLYCTFAAYMEPMGKD